MIDSSHADYFAANRAHWDERVPIHIASRFYDVEGFRAGRDSLQPFEREEMGSVASKSLLHLQCHFGMDTLSWARSGAQVTGLDFSEPAIMQARTLASELGIDAEFVAANVYDAVTALGGRQFDIVYVGMGSLVWLPDVSAWANVVAALVSPGEMLYLVDGHPLSEILADDTLTVANSYFSTEPQVWHDAGTYADAQAVTFHNLNYEWAHPLGATVTAILRAGLQLEFLHERDYSFFQRWPFLEHHADDGTYRMPAGMPSVPMTYSLRARKPT
jgi:SAM-dependent methyltransferase